LLGVNGRDHHPTSPAQDQENTMTTMPMNAVPDLFPVVDIPLIGIGSEGGRPTGTVAVFSAKGGAGRTAIAHNLAVAMSQTAGTSVVLVDGDQVHGDLRLHLEAPESAPSLVHLPTGHVTEADVAPLLWQDATGLDVLLAPPRMEEADLIVLADIRRALYTLRQMYDLVVIDVPATMDERTLAMLDDADVVLDVTTPRHGAVRKTQRCHAVLNAAGFPMDKVLTVVNHADPDYDQADFSEELGWTPDAVLMHDERLASGSVPAGSSIVTAYPDSLFSRGFMELAAQLAPRLQVVPVPASARAA
jgi:pilus assembly protein CpaE